jgi:hypothetical protein
MWKGWRSGSSGECLPSKCGALSSDPSATKQKKKKRKGYVDKVSRIPRIISKRKNSVREPNLLTMYVKVLKAKQHYLWLS